MVVGVVEEGVIRGCVRLAGVVGICGRHGESYSSSGSGVVVRGRAGSGGTGMPLAARSDRSS